MEKPLVVMERSWSIASSTRGFLTLSGGAPPRDQTVTNPSQPGWNRLNAFRFDDDEARQERKAAISEIMVRALGEENVRDMRKLTLKPLQAAPQESPIDLKETIAGRVWQPVTPPLYEVIEGRTQQTQVGGISAVHRLTSSSGPFEIGLSRMEHG